ncbi:MAG TPA: hypothetical protein DEA43_05135 [Candidatus Moranbacteria bacterium]|nr:hypothetical protein [Candidatus Moranbacteria bacterium]HBT46236.1 hypothetical protein [Candidatus Moranbacteria bacterium]
MCTKHFVHSKSSDLPRKLITISETDTRDKARVERIKRPLKAGFNMYTGLQCSTDIEKGAVMTLPESLRPN